MSEYYDILGISKDATKQEIKQAYKRLSVKTHPDKGGNDYLFNQVKRAYETLIDDQKRYEYDTQQSMSNSQSLISNTMMSNSMFASPLMSSIMLPAIRSMTQMHVPSENQAFYSETYVSTNRNGVQETKRTVNDNGNVYTFYD
jgi:curved DNA-binding protein CbpA